MAILLTGGAGFIGSHVCGKLLDEGREVICLDNFDPYYPRDMKERNLEQIGARPGFRLVEGDIRDERLLADVFAPGAVETVIHLAARAGVRASVERPLLYEEVNVGGTMKLLEAMRRSSVRRLVFASSSSVYGDRCAGPFRETDRADRPVSPYAATKLAGEMLVHACHKVYGIDATCLRFFTAYGPRQRPDMAIHKFARLIEEGHELRLYGGGGTLRDYTYVEDIADGVLAAARKLSGFHVYNLGNSEPVPLRELVRLLGEALGKELKVVDVERPAGDVVMTHSDIALARTELGYEPRVGFAEGLRRFVEWFRAAAPRQTAGA